MGTELTAREKFELMKKSMREDKNNAGNPFLQLKAPDKVGDYNEYKVRLLPQKDGTISIFSEYFRHFYKSKITGKYVEVYCPTTKDQPCPICEMNRKLWDSEKEADHKLASYYGRRKNWIIALYVKDDPVTPENNGTVQVLRYGKQIQDKIEAGILNKSIDFAAQDITDEGIDFLIKAQKQKGEASRSVNYNLSEFDRERTAMCDGDPEKVYSDLCPETLLSFQPRTVSYSAVKSTMNKTITGLDDDDEVVTDTPGEEEEIPMDFAKKEPVPLTLKDEPVIEKKVVKTVPKKKVEEVMEEAEVKITPKAKPTVEVCDDDALMSELADLRAELGGD